MRNGLMLFESHNTMDFQGQLSRMPRASPRQRPQGYFNSAMVFRFGWLLGQKRCDSQLMKLFPRQSRRSTETGSARIVMAFGYRRFLTAYSAATRFASSSRKQPLSSRQPNRRR